MSFLFKSKKPAPTNAGLPPSVRKIASRDGSNGVAPGGFSPSAPPLDGDRARSGSAGSALAANSMPGRSAPSPVPGSRQVVPRGQMMDTSRQGPQRPQGQQPPEASLYPWSNQRLNFSDNENPFPRYGSSTNAVSSKDGDIYMMGGLIDGATVKGDLWIVEAGSQPSNCHQVVTTADGPGPRVGHASLMVGNAFIVFGGDTKVDEHDVLDDTLYLLNTATKAWSRVAPSGPRPAGRYGHTLNIIGSKIYIFGGQVDGFFFNDLLAFDLNALQNQTSHWETLVQNSTDGGPPPGQIPPARTNHTIITYDDKLYLFGGTDGVMWYNDVWTYDPRTNAWTQLDCIGFIPAAREGHAAALVDNVMYTFGGRTEEGKDLGDVAGFRIPTRRWYTFQNMGPSPSPRSGHGMTAYENRIVVLGGEPSSAPRNEIELSEVYILDTSKIRYPVEPAAAKSGVTRRPSVTDRSGTPQQDRAASRDGSISSQPGGRSLTTKGSQDSMLSNPASYTRPADAASNGYTNGIMQKPTRSAPSPAPGQAAPQALQQSRANGVRVGAQSVASEGRGSPRLASKLDRAMSPDQTNRDNTPAAVFAQQRARADSHPSATASYGTSHDDYGSKQQYTNEKQQQQQYPNGQQQNFNEQQQYSNEQQQYFNEKQQYPSEKQQQAPSSQQPPLESSLRSDIETPETGVRSADEYMQSNFKQPIYADSGVGSSPALSTQQPDGLVKELEAARSKNAWYESELALAKKSGYRSSSLDSPTSPFDDKTANAFGDEEKPLLEALLRMRAELVRVQQSLETQSTSAAERMAQIEKEKEAAVSEALYARTQLSNNVSTGPGDARGFARLDDTNRRLASTLNAHNDLKMQIQSLSQSLAAERQARETAEASAEAAHSRATTLDSHKKWSSTEIESLRAQLSEAQRDARDLSERHAEAYSSSRSLDVEKQELTTKLNAAQEAQKNHIGVLTALRAAVQASNEKSGLIERQLEQERQQRSTAEQKLTQLRAEHETRMAELESATKSLRDTQDLAESHASEARTHREAVLAGLGSTVSRDYDPSDANDERVSILQQQVEEAGARAQQLKEHADGESYRRRRAEERIAGLEAFQEQQNRESLGLRKQLQGATRDHVTLHGSHAELQQQLQKHKLDITAWEMHHESLKNVLGDRGVDTSDFPRDASELQLSTNNNKRIQQLEEQIEAGNRSQDEMRQTYEIREQELRQTRDAEYRALEKECQQMRNGIEKFNTIASTMKKELDKQKEKNRTLREELDQEKHSRSVSNDGQHQSAAEFENERSKLRQLVDNLQTRLQKSQSEYDSQVRELQSAMSERDHHQQQNQQLQRQLASSRQASTELENLRAENQELRTRTTASEKKVQSLLDTVGSSVNNYRRQSQSMPDLPNGPVGHTRGISSNSIGGDSNYSTHSTTNGLDGNRNSLAQMEAMMNELDSIRGDFERQRQEYSGNRLSTGSMLEGPGPTAGGSALEEDESSAKVHSLADMRRRHLSFDEEDDVDESQTRRLQALA